MRDPEDLAAVAAHERVQPVTLGVDDHAVQDTGDVREDLLELGRAFLDQGLELGAMLTVALLERPLLTAKPAQLNSIGYDFVKLHCIDGLLHELERARAQRLYSLSHHLLGGDDHDFWSMRSLERLSHQ